MKYFLFLLCSLGTLAIMAQSAPLPRHLTSDEKQILENGQYIPPLVHSTINTRSVDHFRTMAEWEELQGVAIAWKSFPAILAEIVKNSVPEVTVYIFYELSDTNEQGIKNYLSGRGIDPEFNIEYIEAPLNSIWIRDYGANPVYLNEVDSLVFVDWIYNRPRYQDDLIPSATAEALGVPLLSTTIAPNDLVHTGGNFMADGLGMGFSSELVLDENGPANNFGTSNHDEEEVNRIMGEAMGIATFPKMTNLPFDLIHHIDMHMKLLDERTLLVGEYPANIADGPQIEENIQYLITQFSNAYGKQFDVKRIPMPPDQFGRYPNTGGDYRTYANALIVNKTILVPVYQERYDTTALRIWSELMPGHEIVGIDCNAIIPLSGALHCITKEIGVNDPLWITHDQPMTGVALEEINLSAQVKHRSGIEEVFLFYRLRGNDGYDSIAMENTVDETWSAPLSSSAEGIVEYYFKARSMSGKQITRPLVAPEGYFTLELEGVTTSVDQLADEITGFSVHPTLTFDQSIIEFDLDQSRFLNVRLIDQNGRIVKRIADRLFGPGRHQIELNLSNLPAGMYYVSVGGMDRQITKRLILIE